MRVHVHPNKRESGEAAAACAARGLNDALSTQDEAGLILATGASQFDMLDSLVARDIDWSRVTVFHLDEYLGIPATHPASFRKYLRGRFVDRVPALRVFHAIQGDTDDPAAECRHLAYLINETRIDVACIGIGENGHLAFNDPPADFETTEPYLVVNLDEACRQQQVGEGWYASLDEVPRQAISMSVQQILKSRRIVCTVPDERKAEAVRRSLEGPATNTVPASILQTHGDCNLFLDVAAASKLTRQPNEY